MIFFFLSERIKAIAPGSGATRQTGATPGAPRAACVTMPAIRAGHRLHGHAAVPAVAPPHSRARGTPLALTATGCTRTTVHLPGHDTPIVPAPLDGGGGPPLHAAGRVHARGQPPDREGQLARRMYRAVGARRFQWTRARPARSPRYSRHRGCIPGPSVAGGPRPGLLMQAGRKPG